MMQNTYDIVLRAAPAILLAVGAMNVVAGIAIAVRARRPAALVAAAGSATLPLIGAALLIYLDRWMSCGASS